MSNDNPYSFASVMSSMSNNFAIIVLVIIFFLGGAVAGSIYTENKMLKSGGSVSGSATAPTAGTGGDSAPGPSGPTEDQLASLPEVTSEDHIRGNADAPVKLVEYSDFECPFCQRFHPTMQQVMEEYGDDVAWVYRHFPLSFHPNAQRAAEASECVADVAGEDAFWVYADAVFEKNGELGGSLTPTAIDEAIAEATSNTQAVNDCIESGEMTDIVTSEMNEGQSSGVSGTPGTFIVTEDGAQELIPGALPFSQVQSSIDQYL